MSKDSINRGERSYAYSGSWYSTPINDVKAKIATGMQYRYQDDNHEYYERQLAHLMVEGVGLLGGPFFLKGHIVVENNELYVSAMGYTAASQMGSVEFWMGAELFRDETSLAQQGLKREGTEVWPKDDWFPIGSATFTLPEPYSPAPLRLTLTGGYIYSAAEGRAVPIPSQHSFSYEVKVISE